MPDVSSVHYTGLVALKSSSVTAEQHKLPASAEPWSTYAGVLMGNKHPSIAEANQLGQYTGPGPQPLRGIPGFPTQPQQNRHVPLGASRLQNGKIGISLIP